MKEKLLLLEKNFFRIGLFLVAALLFGRSALAAEGDVWITPVDQEQEGSQNFTVEVHLDTGGENLGGFNMFFDFDTDYISINTSEGDNGVEKGDDVSSYNLIVNADDISNGHLRFVGNTASGFANSSDVHVATINIQTTSSFTSGDTELDLRVNELIDELANSFSNGTVTGSTVSYPDPGDVTAPVLSEITPVSTPTSDNTPNYTFHTDEAGTISYGGSCSSSTTSASSGNNTITFSTLADGTYSNCTVTVTDASSNASNPLSVTTFVVDTTVPDTTAPVRSSGSPTGTLSAGTTQATLSLSTNENATCRYSTASGVAYASMSGTFSTTGGTSHSTTVTGLTNGNSYHYYVRCQDGSSNSNSNDYSISFSVSDEEEEGEEEDESEDDDIEVPTNDDLDIDKAELKLDGAGDSSQFSSSKKAYSKKEKFSFKGEARGLSGGEVKLYEDGDLEDEDEIDGSGKWSVKAKVKKDDTYEYKIRFYDSNGNEVDSQKYEVKVDTGDPEFTDLPLFLNKRRGEKIWWTAEDDGKAVKRYKYEFLGKKEKLKNESSLTIPANAPTGMHTLKVSAYDKAGNKETRYVMVRIR